MDSQSRKNKYPHGAQKPATGRHKRRNKRYFDYPRGMIRPPAKPLAEPPSPDRPAQ